MQINNPLQMNDLEIGKFLKVILAIQLATWGVIGLDVVGLEIPILRQLIGLIYLTFIPGILILRGHRKIKSISLYKQYLMRCKHDSWQV